VFDRTLDQQLFEETTRRFLDAECPPATVRGLASDPRGYEPSYWQRGAQLGWTSLLVPEDAGGGTISGNGAMDLALVAFQFGMHAAPGPLTATSVVAAALGRWGDDAHRRGPLVELLSGEAAGAWALAEPAPHDDLGEVELRADARGRGFTLHGVKSPVEAGAQAAHVLVVARTALGLAQFLVPAGSRGLTVTALGGVDLSRRFARLEFDDVLVPASALVGAAGSAAPAVQWLLDLAVTIQLAEMCGAMTWAFGTTFDWASNRYSFGRPLSSYQEIKHRFADMKTWLEASYAICGDAARAMAAEADGGPSRSERASAGKFFVGRYGVELMQDCVQMHGGIGVTSDHDLHLFLRRVVTDAPIYGTPAQHADRLTAILADRETGG
jgi:alkylation response protein AidB-like acyl-CoA dehydrogenase